MSWTTETRARAAERCRANRPSAHSTGPRTDVGKARAAQNARRHGHRDATTREFLRLLAAFRRRIGQET